MKLSRLFVAYMMALLAVATLPVVAGDSPLPKYAERVKRAVIGPMIDPPGSFAITYWAKDVSGQCPINPNWTVTVTERADIDGTYIQSVCPRTGPTPCECDIYVRSGDTKKAWEAALEPYRQEHTATLPIDPSSEVPLDIR